MKLKDEDLKKLYKAYIREKIPLSRKNCPSPREIINFFGTKSSEYQKSKIIEHITNCHLCAQEFEFILKTLRYEMKLEEEIGSLLISQKETVNIKKRADKIASNSRKKLISFFPHLSWRYASFAVGFIILIALISALAVFKNSEKREYRSANFPKINLIEPVNGKYSKSPLIFKWGKSESSDYYILELFDETLFPLWKSNKIFKNHTILPQEIEKTLTKNKMYFWMITAFFPEGGKIESRIEEFIFKE